MVKSPYIPQVVVVNLIIYHILNTKIKWFDGCSGKIWLAGGLFNANGLCLRNPGKVIFMHRNGVA